MEKAEFVPLRVHEAAMLLTAAELNFMSVGSQITAEYLKDKRGNPENDVLYVQAEARRDLMDVQHQLAMTAAIEEIKLQLIK